MHAESVTPYEALQRITKVARDMPDLEIVPLELFFSCKGIEESNFVDQILPNSDFAIAFTKIRRRSANLWQLILLLLGRTYPDPTVRKLRVHDRHTISMIEDIISVYYRTAADMAAILGVNAKCIFKLESSR